jgi:nucleoside-diphosphate-sugar epimerase
MSNYLIIGAGPIGNAVTRRLIGANHQVTVLTRSGSGLDDAGVCRVVGDAADTLRVSGFAASCDAIFNCANPKYHRWAKDWPPVANALQAAAERSGATLVTLSNLYAYGPGSGPMRADTPLAATYEKARVRATMWTNALTAHNEGRIHAVEVRASDFVGPNASAVMSSAMLERIVKGKRCWVMGSPDMPHSWTYTDDVARALVACADTPASWGRAWIAPTNEPRTQREMINEFADIAGVARVKVSSVPTTFMRILGVASPLIREFPKTVYQFNEPFVVDDTATRAELGLEPTPWVDVLKSTIATL